MKLMPKRVCGSYTLRCLPHGEYVICSDRYYNAVWVWDLEDASHMACLSPNMLVALNGFDGTLIAASYGANLFVWRCKWEIKKSSKSLKKVKRYKLHHDFKGFGMVRSVVMDTEFAYSVDYDGVLRFWNLRKKKILHRCPTHGASSNQDLALTPSSLIVNLRTENGGSIKIWNRNPPYDLIYQSENTISEIIATSPILSTDKIYWILDHNTVELFDVQSANCLLRQRTAFNLRSVDIQSGLIMVNKRLAGSEYGTIPLRLKEPIGDEKGEKESTAENPEDSEFLKFELLPPIPFGSIYDEGIELVRSVLSNGLIFFIQHDHGYRTWSVDIYSNSTGKPLHQIAFDFEKQEFITSGVFLTNRHLVLEIDGVVHVFSLSQSPAVSGEKGYTRLDNKEDGVLILHADVKARTSIVLPSDKMLIIGDFTGIGKKG